MRLLYVLLPIVLSAQTTLTVTGPANSIPGAIVPLVLGLSGSTGRNLTGLQWTLGGALSSPVAGAASSAATKTIYCSATNSNCLLIGVNAAKVITNAPFADGPVATFTMTVPANAPAGSLAIPLSALFGTSATGAEVPITAGVPYSITILSKCDTNADGKVDGNDVLQLINALTGNGVCPLAGGCTLQATVGVLFAALGGACPL